MQTEVILDLYWSETTHDYIEVKCTVGFFFHFLKVKRELNILSKYCLVTAVAFGGQRINSSRGKMAKPDRHLSGFGALALCWKRLTV